MIPIRLQIAGFLSYREPVELNFDGFQLACIAGQNGAGKSALLDAITWALFGEARGKNADVINLHPDVKAAEATLTFAYEGNEYRAQRRLPRGKSATLEFQIKAESGWRPLTEKSVRETQTRIEQILRLDYETFTNASFFLQGRADQFAQKKSGERKALLSSILGLEIWDEYKARAAEKRKTLEDDAHEIEVRISEIDSELGEEAARKRRLAELEDALRRLSAARTAQEAALEQIRKNATLLGERRKLAETLSAALERARAALTDLEKSLAENEAQLAGYVNLTQRAPEIEAAYATWQKARIALEELETAAERFRAHAEKRQPLIQEIEVERARLEQEREALSDQLSAISNQSAAIGELEKQIEGAQKSLAEAQARIEERSELEAQRNDAREKVAALRVENETLKAAMNELKERLDALNSAAGAECPLCGQPLSAEHRQSTLARLESEGKEKGDAFREHKKEIDQLERQIADYQLRITNLAPAEDERVKYSNAVSQLSERLAAIRAAETEWRQTGGRRLEAVTPALAEETFAEDARRKLEALDAELAQLGYDSAAHGATRRAEAELRGADEEYRKLDKAREVMRQVESVVANQKAEMEKRKTEVENLAADLRAAQEQLAEAAASAPDLRQAEDGLRDLREEENETRQQVGGARQKAEALTTLRARKKDLAAQREELQLQIARYKTLERACGKDGVPALLIEQALPQIEDKANELLERLSAGRVSVRFITQSEYKDKKREDLKETLEIQISDDSGARAYETYSGGEAFRINFAIRLALAEILAQRKGARLQTLVIDEGFGSQDAEGRQLLVEALNRVKGDFAKILIITHLDELKDAFPNRIEVEKTERGSTARVV